MHVVLAALRRRATLAAAAAVAALLVAAGCRTERIWSGVELQTDGTVKLASEEPMCGCLFMANVSKTPVRVRASHGGRTLGQVILQPNARGRFRFDWGGTLDNADYMLAVSSRDGTPLDARTVLVLDEHPTWVLCEDAPCDDVGLMMNLGVTQR